MDFRHLSITNYCELRHNANEVAEVQYVFALLSNVEVGLTGKLPDSSIVDLSP